MKLFEKMRFSLRGGLVGALILMNTIGLFLILNHPHFYPLKQKIIRSLAGTQTATSSAKSDKSEIEEMLAQINDALKQLATQLEEKALSDKEPSQERSKAIIELSHMGQTSSIPVLFKIIEEGESRLQRIAASALTQDVFATPQQIDFKWNELLHTDRVHMEEALSEMIFDESRKNHVYYLLMILGNVGEEKAAESLIRFLAVHPDLGAPQGVLALEKCLYRINGYFMDLALQTLNEIKSSKMQETIQLIQTRILNKVDEIILDAEASTKGYEAFTTEGFIKAQFKKDYDELLRVRKKAQALKGPRRLEGNEIRYIQAYNLREKAQIIVKKLKHATDAYNESLNFSLPYGP